jgi:PAS domain S-box-containing protein
MPRETENYRKHIRAKADKAAEALTLAIRNLSISTASPADVRKLKADLKGMLKHISEAVNELEHLDASVLGRIDELKNELSRYKKEKVKVDEALVHTTREGMIVADTKGIVVFANRSAKDLLGYKAVDDLVGQSVFGVFRWEDEHGHQIPLKERPIRRAVSSGKKVLVSVHDSLYVVRQDKTRFPVMMTVSPTAAKGSPTGITILFHEIKKRSDRMRTDFISIASHQLRTPLTVSNLQVDMLLAGHAGELTHEQREYIEEIRYYNQKMAQVLNEFLTVSRIERGTFVIDPKPADVVGIAEDVVRELLPQAIHKGIDIIERYQKNFPTIVTDPEFMRIVFHNLVSNAIKYTPEGGKVTIDVRHKERGVTIKVTDTGYGIPAEEKEKIFTKMFRGKKAESREPNGMGLGLYIVKTLLERCGGTVRFSSKEHAGTVFTVTLPLRLGRRYRAVVQ